MKNGIVRFQFVHSVPRNLPSMLAHLLPCRGLLCPFEPLHQPSKRPGIRQPRKRNSTNSYVRIYKLFMQNKAKVKYAKININTFVTMRYDKMDIWLFRQNKPNSNPIKANTKPIQSQFNPKQTQFKPNSKPISILGSNEKIRPNERIRVKKLPR